MTEAAVRVAGLKRWQHLLLALIAGMGAALGLAPFDLPFLSIFGFAAVLGLVAVQSRPWASFWTALTAGTGYFGLALHWIVEPFLVDPLSHGWMAPFALVLLAAGMALFWAVPAGLSRRWAGGRVSAMLLLLLPFISLGEFARAYVLSGFPWAHPGHIWIGSPLMGLSAWGGAHGMTLFTLAIAAGMAAAVIWRPVAILAAIFLVVLGYGLSATRPVASPASDTAAAIRLVQPNAPQHLKWRPDMIPVFFDRSLELTRQPGPGGGTPDLVIWPETALPVLLSESEFWRLAIAEAAGGAQVLVGGQRIAEDGTARNSGFLLDQTGAVAAQYDKHHLVPFGEYIPLAGFLRQLGVRALADASSSGYGFGPGPQTISIPGVGTSFPMICYEAIFPHYIRQVDRPDWLVQITNDAWFGEFAGPQQHLELAQLRAAEQGLPLLRSANTGISALIDAQGAVVDHLPLGEAGALDVRLPPPLPPTFYARTGDRPIIVLLFLLLAGVAWRVRKNGH